MALPGFFRELDGFEAVLAGVAPTAGTHHRHAQAGLRPISRVMWSVICGQRKRLRPGARKRIGQFIQDQLPGTIP
jgi:hypothetical protein